MKTLTVFSLVLSMSCVALAGRFQHPGIGLNREQLDQHKKNVAEGVNRFIAIGEDFWWGRGTFLNQLQFTLGGPLARYHRIYINAVV